MAHPSKSNCNQFCTPAQKICPQRPNFESKLPVIPYDIALSSIGLIVPG